MKLPNAENAWVQVAKARDYLLVPDHPDGGSKADFLLHFGFNREQWWILADALRIHGANHEVTSVTETPHGPIFTVDGTLNTPDGRNPQLRTVWIIDHGSDVPRLVSAYPRGRRI